MKGKILIVILSIISVYAQAQNIVRDSILNAGFHKNINELIDNNPSTPFQYKITDKIIKVGGLAYQEVLVYNIDIDDNNANDIGDIIGFSDGKDIYLKTIRTGMFAMFKSNKLGKKTNFIKVKERGVYIYYYTISTNSTMTYSGMPGSPPSSVTSQVYEPHVLNSLTQTIEVLNTKKMKKLLTDEPDLLDEFNKDKDRKKNFDKYIIEYNKRYKAKGE